MMKTVIYFDVYLLLCYLQGAPNANRFLVTFTTTGILQRSFTHMFGVQIYRILSSFV